MKRKPTRNGSRKSNDKLMKRDKGERVRFSKRLVRVFEDRDLIAIDKPAGMLSVAIKGSDVPSAYSLLSQELREQHQRCFVVHRIDRFTSGLLLFAKSKEVRERMIKQFVSREPKREYIAVVQGDVKKERGELVHYLVRDMMYQKVSRKSDTNASEAKLNYRVEKRLRGMTVVRVNLVSGFQNQIRVQFAEIGHPLIGDRKYGTGATNERRISRLALHAARLSFIHPRTKTELALNCPIPSDMERLIGR